MVIISKTINLRCFWAYFLGIFIAGVCFFLDFNDEANEEEILETCENCDLTEPKTSILIHIGNTKACKAHYGPRFKAMKALNDQEELEKLAELAKQNVQEEIYKRAELAKLAKLAHMKKTL